MVTTHEAEQLIFSNLPMLGNEAVPVEQSLGRILGEDIYSPEDSPLFNNSAMDGFAVRWIDVKNVDEQNSVKLSLIGESSAGHPYMGNAVDGKAISISTGALVSDEFDTIIPVEDCEFNETEIVVKSVKKNGQHIRIKGEEFKSGDKLVEVGSVVDPAIIALLSLVGVKVIVCRKTPIVSIITTGSELVKIGVELKLGQIRDSNTPMIQNLLTISGAVVANNFHVEDSFNKTLDVIETAVEKSDILIFSGGVSVGQHDHVKPAAKAAGFTEIFWKINQKPGKPMFFAKRKNTLLFGLPGNPASAVMNFVKYVHPTILRMQDKNSKALQIKGITKNNISNNTSRTNLSRVKIEWGNEIPSFEILGKQGSHMLTSVSAADGFITVDGETQFIVGDEVEITLFPWKSVVKF